MPKVLYIEDEPDIVELVRRWLEEDDHDFLHARDGQAGLALAADERPDLILLDIGLGAFSPDGWEVIRALKADPRTRAIPVLALTAQAAWAEDRDRALREGFVEHICKPFDYETLSTKVRDHAGGGAA
jgi:CheY-like chemotaxis protein